MGFLFKSVVAEQEVSTNNQPSIAQKVSQTSQSQFVAGPVASSSQVATSPAPDSSEEKEGSRKWAWLAIALLGLIAAFYLARNVVPRILVYFTRASNAPGNYSLANSYVFGSPLLAQANGKDKIRVTAFLLDAKGRGVPGRQVAINLQAKDGSQTGLPQVVSVQPNSDDFGRTIFEVSSSTPGQFIVTATIDGLEFPQAVTLTFN